MSGVELMSGAKWQKLVHQNSTNQPTNPASSGFRWIWKQAVLCD